MKQKLALGIIPARFSSTRFPGKLLEKVNGKSLLERTYNKACAAQTLDRVLIAAGDEKILEHARSFTNDVVEAFFDVSSGTERIAHLPKRSSRGSVDREYSRR